MSRNSSDSEDEEVKIIIDNGSYRIKAGFAGDDVHRSIFPTVVGKPMYEGQFIGGKMSSKQYYVGDSALYGGHTGLDLSRPIERGVVTDWEDMEKIWHHTFYSELRVKPQDRHILITEPPLNPKSNKEKMVQAMFENFNVRSMFIICPNILGSFAAGRSSCLVLDCGYELSHVFCMYESNIFPHSFLRSEIGGNDVTNYLIELLGKRGYTFTTDKEREDLNCLKERLACASVETKSENTKETHKSYKLSSGNSISVGNELFQCSEALFHPEVIGVKTLGVHELVINSIRSCPSDVHGDICVNIIVTGSTTMLPGFSERLKKEISPFLPCRINVVAAPERRSSTWIGGSILGSLSYTGHNWMKNEEYQEYGPNLVYKSCFNF